MEQDQHVEYVSQRPPQRLWKKAYMVWAIVIVNVLWFRVVEGMHGYNGAGYLLSGALDRPDVLHGQWYRLISAMFVHFGVSHIALNMVSLFSLYIVELIMDRWVFAFIYLISGIMGNVLSLLFLPNSVAFGASGAVFGIFGAAIVLSFRGILSKSARNQLLIILALNLVYGFVNPQIDSSAHIGGLLAGMAVTYFMSTGRFKVRPIRILGMGLSVLTVIALVWTLNGGSSLVA
jgi:rhomboid protease GluP